MFFFNPSQSSGTFLNASVKTWLDLPQGVNNVRMYVPLYLATKDVGLGLAVPLFICQGDSMEMMVRWLLPAVATIVNYVKARLLFFYYHRW